MDLIRRINRKSVIVLLPAAAASAFIEGWRMPAGVLAGGLLALVNLRGLARGVQGLLGAERVMAKMIFFSQFRLVMLFMMIGLLVYLKLANIFGILIGFSIVFAVILVEGYKGDKKEG